MEWQPIETAPQDGTTVLACCQGMRWHQVLFWMDDAGDDWTSEWMNMAGKSYSPTHWMPLPEPPS